MQTTNKTRSLTCRVSRGGWSVVYGMKVNAGTFFFLAEEAAQGREQID